MIDTVAATPAWFMASTVIQALAAAAVASFAFAQWRRDRLRTREHVAAIDSRASTTAFLLRRQLLSWLGKPSPGEDDFESWIRNSDLKPHLDIAEQRAIELGNLSGEASKRVGTGIRMAFVLFLNGTKNLNEYHATPRPHHDIMAWLRLRDDAAKDLRQCAKTLEATVINPELLLADSELNAIRDAEDPIRQFAEVLRKMSKSVPPVAKDSG